MEKGGKKGLTKREGGRDIERERELERGNREREMIYKQ